MKQFFINILVRIQTLSSSMKQSVSNWHDIIGYSILLNLSRFQDNKITIREILLWNKGVGSEQLAHDLRKFYDEMDHLNQETL